MPALVALLTLSKPYVALAYRDKFVDMSKIAGSTSRIGLICPPRWAQQEFEAFDQAPPYWHQQVDIRLNGRNHFHSYHHRQLLGAVQKFAPSVFNIEEEHYSLVTAQCVAIARKIGARPMFYSWQNIFKNYPPPFQWIERYVFAHCPAAIVGNGEAADVLRRKGYQGLIAKIPQMGVTPARFSTKMSKQECKNALGFHGSEVLIGFAGRIVEEKGIADLLHAMTHLTSCKLVIVGNGPDLARLQNICARLHLGNKAVFRAGVASHEFPIYMRAFDIFCLPSLTRSNWKEQFGRVLIEAMASETVTVGSSSGEIPNVIGSRGKVFREGDTHDLAAKLRDLIESPNLRVELSRIGRCAVDSQFSNAVIGERFFYVAERIEKDAQRGTLKGLNLYL